MERRLSQKSPEPSEGQSLHQGRGSGVQREEVSSRDVKEVELAKKDGRFLSKAFSSIASVYILADAVRMLCVVLMLKLQPVLKFSQHPSYPAVLPSEPE